MLGRIKLLCFILPKVKQNVVPPVQPPPTNLKNFKSPLLLRRKFLSTEKPPIPHGREGAR